MRSIVLDKSYLQAAPRRVIRQMCDDYNVLMCEALFFELLEDDENRPGCFAKFPPRVSPVVVVGHPGMFLRHEIEKGEPASPVDRRPLFERFEFHPALAAGTFEFTE